MISAPTSTAAAAVAAEDYEGAMAALAELRPAVDAFFDNAPYVGAVRDSASNWTLNWTRWLND